MDTHERMVMKTVAVIIHVGAVEKEGGVACMFYKSGFPARYGGRLSSVVDVRTADGKLNLISILLSCRLPNFPHELFHLLHHLS